MKKQLFKKVHTRVIHAGSVCACLCGADALVNSTSHLNLNMANSK